MINSYNNYNPWETEEQKKQRLNNSFGTAYNPNQAQTPYKPMEEMTTREALEYAWNKQHPYGGEVTMTGSLGDFSYYDENLNKPKEGQPVTGSARISSTQPMAFASQAFNARATANNNTIKNVSSTAPTSNNATEPEYLRYLNRHRNRLCSPEFEGNFKHAYLDSAENPNATFGCGINIDDTPGIQLQNRQTGEPFTADQQKNELAKLRASYRPNYRASYYADKSNIGISEAEHERQLQLKYGDAYENVKKKYPNFDNFTSGQQDALLDMNYNMGTPAFNEYVIMKGAANAGKWDEAAKESNRPGIGQIRNDWTAQNLDPEWKKRRRRW